MPNPNYGFVSTFQELRTRGKIAEMSAKNNFKQSS